jgi:hypothetical protein
MLGTELGQNYHGKRVKAWFKISKVIRVWNKEPPPTRATYPLQSPASDELVQALRKTTSQGKCEEDNIGSDKGIAPAHYIGDARKGHSAAEIGKRVGQGDPIDAADVLKVNADAVDAGGDDGGVYNGEEEPKTYSFKNVE